MIINAIITHGRKVRIECTSEIKEYDRPPYRFRTWGRRWIKSRNKFSSNILGNCIISYEIEPSNARTAKSLNDSGVFAPFIVVGED